MHNDVLKLALAVAEQVPTAMLCAQYGQLEKRKHIGLRMPVQADEAKHLKTLDTIEEWQQKLWAVMEQRVDKIDYSVISHLINSTNTFYIQIP